LFGNYSFIDFWSYHLRASSLASEVHELSYKQCMWLTIFWQPIFAQTANWVQKETKKLNRGSPVFAAVVLRNNFLANRTHW
jgi:hypothetical protein